GSVGGDDDRGVVVDDLYSADTLAITFKRFSDTHAIDAPPSRPLQPGIVLGIVPLETLLLAPDVAQSWLVGQPLALGIVGACRHRAQRLRLLRKPARRPR